MMSRGSLLLMSASLPIGLAYSRFETSCTRPESVTNYVSSPDTRGLLEIIWTCLATVITCTYTVLHLNVPKNGASDWHCLWHNIGWAAITIIAPEIILCKAIINWSEAYRHWRDLKAATSEHWTLTHMLYADMGGFFYCADSAHTETIKATYGIEGFVVSAKVLKEADEAGILPKTPPMTKEEILDKSKSNCFDKVVTIGQLVYFCVSIIVRVTESLTITQLELTVCGFAVCSISTYLFTFLKPKGVNTRSVFRHSDIETFERFLMIAAGPSDDRTDLEVAAHVGSGSATTCTVRLGDSRLLTPVAAGNGIVKSDLEAQRRRDADDKRRKRASETARNALQNVKNNPFSGEINAAWFLVPLISIPVGAIHIAGWNLDFPTFAELWLWRSAAIASTAVLPLGLVVAVILLLPLAWVLKKLSIREDVIWVMAVILAFLVAATYVGSRLILLVEMLRCLFYLEPDAFVATWTANMPHIG